MTRTTGTLTAEDLGKDCRIEWEGWVHTGTLDFVHHKPRYGGSEDVQTFLGLKSETGARWMGHVPADYTIEVRA